MQLRDMAIAQKRATCALCHYLEVCHDMKQSVLAYVHGSITTDTTTYVVICAPPVHGYVAFIVANASCDQSLLHLSTPPFESLPLPPPTPHPPLPLASVHPIQGCRHPGNVAFMAPLKVRIMLQTH